MSKNMRYLILVMLLIGPLALAACGGDDDDQGDNSDSSVVELNKDFSAETVGISLKYPAGWNAVDDGTQVTLANRANLIEQMQNGLFSAAKFEEGEFGLLVAPLVLAELGMETVDLDTAFGKMTDAMTSEGITANSTIKAIKISGKDAKQLDITGSETNSDGFIIAFMDDDGAMIAVIGIAAEDTAGDYEDVARQIAATVDWTAPAAE